MTPQTYTINPDQTITLDKKVRSLDVSVGSVTVTETDNPVLVKTDESFEADDTAALTLYSPDGANVAVYYFDEHPAIPDPDNLELEVAQAEKAEKLAEEQNRPTGVEAAQAKAHQARRRLDTFHPDEPQRKEPASPRGDSGGNTGSFESRTTKELRVTAKERQIKGYSGMKKRELIKALRA
jgi:Rho termination factor-like protein